MNNNELYKKVAEAKGIEHQDNMLIEELAEAITAINHYKRKRVTIDKVCEELSDVEILIEQFKQNHNCEDKIYINKKIKLNRLKKNLDNNKL